MGCILFDFVSLNIYILYSVCTFTPDFFTYACFDCILFSSATVDHRAVRFECGGRPGGDLALSSGRLSKADYNLEKGCWCVMFAIYAKWD